MKFQPLFLLLLLPPSLGLTAEYKLYFLGGQSNMDGYGYVKELGEGFNAPDATYIFHGNPSPDAKPVDGRGLWTKLRPGHGVGFSSDGTTNRYSNRFGVELTFASRLRELAPSDKIAIVKYSRGGTSIAIDAAGPFGCWDPDFTGGQGAGKGINQYDHFLATVRNSMATSDIDGDGEADKLTPAGIVWMQGESDAAYSAEIAGQYEANLRRLMDLIRAAFRVDDIPVVIGRISDSGQEDDGTIWDHGEVVRKAQADFVKKDGTAAIVTSTDSYGYSDKWHYDSKGYIDLGTKFAEALEKFATE